MIDFITAILKPDVIGMLDRDVTVALAEVSRRGCLLESTSAIPVGTLATLSVDINGEAYFDEVRVARCDTLAGGGERHHVGVEFLTLRRPGHQSLRIYAASLAADTLRPKAPLSVRLRAAL